MSELVQQLPLETLEQEPISAEPADKKQEAFRFASDMYRQSPDWITFHREILGVDGILRKMFPNPQMLEAFEKSFEHAEIQQMLARLRERSKHPNEPNEPTSVITVRLPKSLHEALRHESHERKTSMNQLCISKLLQFIDAKLVPAD